MKLTLRTKVAAYWLMTAVALAIVVQGGLLPLLLPDRLAHQVGNAGEGLAMAAILVVIVQVVRPWAVGTGHRYLSVVPLAALCLGLAAVLLFVELPPSVATFSEPFTAGAMLLFLLLVPRPTTATLLVTPLMFLVLTFGHQVDLVFRQTEAFVLVMLAPLLFDVVDRSILDPDAPPRRVLTAVWCVVLATVWLPLWLAATSVRPEIEGFAENAIDLAHRGSEAYWGLLVTTVYFAYWLGSDWRTSPAARCDLRREDADGPAAPVAP